MELAVTFSENVLLKLFYIGERNVYNRHFPFIYKHIQNTRI